MGSRVWARAEKGCFFRGIVTEMNDEIHVKLDNGKKIRHKRSHAECIVADVIPHAMEVEIGTRVLAKWYNRLDTFYPGTVVAVRRSLFDIRFDDGDKGCNELRELRILGPKTEGTMYIRRYNVYKIIPFIHTFSFHLFFPFHCI